MFEKIKTAFALMFVAVMMNLVGYHYFFSDFELEYPSTVIVIELPDVEPLYNGDVGPIAESELYCMAKNIFHEARNQSVEGQFGVAFVTMNRVDHVDFPNTVCEVVFAPSQFSWTISPPQVDKGNPIEYRAWKVAKQVAFDSLSGVAYNDFFGILHYHADYVNPNWYGLELAFVIDTHLFYQGD